MSVSVVNELIQNLNLEISDFNTRFAKLSALDRKKDIGEFPEILSGIKNIRKKITKYLSQLSKEADKKIKGRDQEELQDYVLMVETLLSKIKIDSVGQDPKFSADFDSYELCIEQHMTEIDSFLSIRREVGDGRGDIYFSLVGAGALKRIDSAMQRRTKAHKKLQLYFVRDVALFKKKLNESFSASHNNAKKIRSNVKTAAWDRYTNDKQLPVDKLGLQIERLSYMVHGALSELAKLRLDKATSDDYFGKRGLLLMKYIESLEKQVSVASKKISRSYALELEAYKEDNIKSGNDVTGVHFDDQLWNLYQDWLELDTDQEKLFVSLKDNILANKTEKEIHSVFTVYRGNAQLKTNIIDKMHTRYMVVIRERNEDWDEEFSKTHPVKTASKKELGFFDLSGQIIRSALEEWVGLFSRDDGAFFEERGKIYFKYIKDLQKERLKEVNKMFEGHKRRLRAEEGEAEKQAKLASHAEHLI